LFGVAQEVAKVIADKGQSTSNYTGVVSKQESRDGSLKDGLDFFLGVAMR
jgi:hypothetical protein